MAVEVIVDFHPLVYMRLSGALEVEDVRQMAKRFGAVFERGALFTNITDTRAVKSVPSASERREVAAFLRDIESSMRRYCRGSSTLIDSQLLRGALTAIYWIVTPPVPQQFPASIDEGLDWCSTRMLEAGADERMLEAARVALAKHLGERARLAS